MPTKNLHSNGPHQGSITVTVVDSGGVGGVLTGAAVSLYRRPDAADCSGFDPLQWQADEALHLKTETTDDDGLARFTPLEPAAYVVLYEHHPVTPPICVALMPGCAESVCLRLPLDVEPKVHFTNPDCVEIRCPQPRVGDRAHVKVCHNDSDSLYPHVELEAPRGALLTKGDPFAFTVAIRQPGAQQLEMALLFAARRALPGGGGPVPAARYSVSTGFDADEREPMPITGTVNVALNRAGTEPTADLRLWGAIRASSEALSYKNYERFMELLFCSEGKPPAEEAAAFRRLLNKRFLPFTDTDAYRVMKVATEAFVTVNCGVFTGTRDVDGDMAVLGDFRDYLARRELPAPVHQRYLENVDGIRMLPYLAIIRRKLPDVPIVGPLTSQAPDIDLCDGFLSEKLRNPCLIELIGSYWLEEAGVAQTMNLVMRRFQNLPGPNAIDPLVNMEFSPLRRLNNLLWGYVADEQHRLSVIRRGTEYKHHYGLQLLGRAVRQLRSADTRSNFVEAFHRLLRQCTEFYRQDDQTMVKADAFGVLNALKELHLILSEGASGQFGDMPSTALIEDLMRRWLLSRPEFREVLPGRPMAASPARWNDTVDAMRRLQGWGDTSSVVFDNLATFGSMILLAVRYGAWSVEIDTVSAFNFARFFRPQIQGYVHAYRAATGAELGALTVDAHVDTTMPSLLLRQRMVAQRRAL